MENAFSEKYKYAFRNLELKELRRFILKELISSPELDNQLTNSRHDLQGKRVQDKRVQINRIRAASRQGRDQTYGPEVF
ncbi:hypothetical protein ELQ43_11435 [Salmonella enterica subsp. enterica serovar Typhi]|nr:hypothetical protein [Salmonella enterica subsp. enterica serovar Typhi]